MLASVIRRRATSIVRLCLRWQSGRDVNMRIVESLTKGVLYP